MRTALGWVAGALALASCFSNGGGSSAGPSSSASGSGGAGCRGGASASSSGSTGGQGGADVSTSSTASSTGSSSTSSTGSSSTSSSSTASSSTSSSTSSNSTSSTSSSSSGGPASCSSGPTSCDYHVPGDYSTIQAAIAAIRSNVNDSSPHVVCVADGTYVENLTDPGGGGALTITGGSAANVVINGSVTIPFALGACGSIAFENVTITQSVTSQMKLTLQACVIQGGVSVSPWSHLPNCNLCILDVEACDISAPGGTALSLTDTSIDQGMTVTVRNSYLHVAATGIYVGPPKNCWGFTFVNNTIQGVTTGISANVPPPQWPCTNTLLSANNLVTGATTAITTAQWAGDFHDDALWGNTTNYAGTAMPGMGDVTADPMLTGTMPPGLSAGSPLIGAGDATLLPTCDFFGKPRNGRADIGAVEGP